MGNGVRALGFTRGAAAMALILSIGGCGTEELSSGEDPPADPPEQATAGRFSSSPCEVVDPEAVMNHFVFDTMSETTDLSVTTFALVEDLTFTFTGCGYGNGTEFEDPPRATCPSIDVRWVQDAEDGSGGALPVAEVTGVARDHFAEQSERDRSSGEPDRETLLEDLPEIGQDAFAARQRSQFGESVYAFASTGANTLVLEADDPCTDVAPAQDDLMDLFALFVAATD